jgi:hypothetical protein
MEREIMTILSKCKLSTSHHRRGKKDEHYCPIMIICHCISGQPAPPAHWQEIVLAITSALYYTLLYSSRQQLLKGIDNSVAMDCM